MADGSLQNVDYIAQHVPDVDSSPKRLEKDGNDTDFQSNHSSTDDDVSSGAEVSEKDGPIPVPKPRTTKGKPAKKKKPTSQVPA